MHVSSHAYDQQDLVGDDIFYTIPLEDEDKEEEKEPTFQPLTRGTTVSESETNVAQIEYWLKALMLVELEAFHATQAKQETGIHWSDTLVQAAHTYSKSEYDRRGPNEADWTRMPCTEYEPEDFIDEQAGHGISEFLEDTVETVETYLPAFQVFMSIYNEQQLQKMP
jgi:hypothetical protein